MGNAKINFASKINFETLKRIFRGFFDYICGTTPVLGRAALLLSITDLVKANGETLDHQLVTAAKQGNVTNVEFLLKEGANPSPQMALERRDEARRWIPMVFELSISMSKLAILLLISRVLLPVRDFRIELRDWKDVEASHTPFNVLLLVNCQAGQRV